VSAPLQTYAADSLNAFGYRALGFAAVAHGRQTASTGQYYNGKRGLYIRPRRAKIKKVVEVNPPQLVTPAGAYRNQP